jgi:HD-GYP domain-containing protein (c-di-GMP phosphodiesterase class II)
MRLRSLRLAAACAVALAAGGVGVAGHTAGWLPSVEQDAVGARFALRAAPAPPGVTVVAIDTRTFVHYQERSWPNPRTMHARAIDRLRRAGARVIVYDIQFTEATRPKEDAALFESVRRARNVVLATSEVDDRGRTNVFGGDDNVAAANAVVGVANVEAAGAGVVDRFPYSVSGRRSLAVVAAERSGAPPVSRERFPAAGARIDFAGPPGTIPTLSFSDLLQGRFDRDLVRGRVVVVGATVPTLHDLHPTPMAGGRLMAGPEIQANAIATVQRGLPLRDAPGWMQVLLIVLLAAAVPLLAVRVRVLAVAAGALVALAALAAAAQLAFAAGVVVDVTWTAGTLALSSVMTVVAGYAEANAHRRRVQLVNDVLEERVRERTVELRRSELEVVRRLALAGEHRDTETGRHVERIAVMFHQLALAAGLAAEDAERMGHAAILHDVGKIAIPDAVLHKPGRFTPEERGIMERHAEAGSEMLAGSPSRLMQDAEVIALTHHERWDGSGYPNGLAGEEIPLAGRICAVCDVFDALVSKRVYKGAMSLDEAVAILVADRGTHFDPELVDLFVPMAPALYERLHRLDGTEPLDWTLAFAETPATAPVPAPAPAPERPVSG